MTQFELHYSGNFWVPSRQPQPSIDGTEEEIDYEVKQQQMSDSATLRTYLMADRVAELTFGFKRLTQGDKAAHNVFMLAALSSPITLMSEPTSGTINVVVSDFKIRWVPEGNCKWSTVLKFRRI